MGEDYLPSVGEPEPTEAGPASVTTAGHSAIPADRLVILIARGLSASLLLAVGGSHLVLYFVGYGDIPRIGKSFLVNAVVGLVLAVTVLTVSKHSLPVVAALGSLFMVGTLGALTLSLTVGLFGFVDALSTPLVPTTLALELAGVEVLLGTTVVATRVRRSH
jgi:hypothetical protein